MSISFAGRAAAPPTALHPPGPPTVAPRALRAILAAVALSLLFVAAFVVPGHDPQPNGLPVVQVGAPAGLVKALAAEDIELTAVGDRAAAERAVRDREAYGAIVPGPDGRPEVLVAGGASAAAATTLAAAAGRARIPVAGDLVPLAAGDRRGATLNLLVLPLVITAIIGALMAVQLLPEIGAGARVALTAVVGLLAGLGAVGIVRALDALPGSFLVEAGMAGLMVLGVGLTAGAIVRRLGPQALVVAFLLFLVVGNPASGLASAPELLPSPWKELGGLLPPGALGDALRGEAYFDGAGVMGPVLVLLAWVLIGAAAHVALDRRASTGPPAQAEPELSR